ncbi:hypothetical protein ABXT06_02695 [Flavobacterium sp. UW10123]|uniref:hypothetical protein n=1 Tax=Flavobacterium sp. UW10123 TaxID=3230800 RepID=UPI003398AC31
MKKLILFIAFAVLFTIFSCTAEEYETQPVKKIEKIDGHAGNDKPDGPGDEPKPPVKS